MKDRFRTAGCSPLERVRQQGKRLGHPKVAPKVENAIRTHLGAGNGILKVATLAGAGSGTVQRVSRELVAKRAAAVVHNWFLAVWPTDDSPGIGGTPILLSAASPASVVVMPVGNRRDIPLQLRKIHRLGQELVGAARQGGGDGVLVAVG